MIALRSFLVPTLVSAVAVFIVSSLIHMVLKWHASDYKGLAKEDAAAEGLRASNPAPGIYRVPHCADMKEMSSPAMQAKYKDGPVAMVVVMPNGAPAMGKLLGLWFGYGFVVSLFCAYLASRTLGAAAADLRIFRLVGTIAFMAYALPNLVDSIWKGFPWSVSLKHFFDGALYAAATGAAFCWLWPR